ncbi:unnamed protein product [Rangifer tarandus platyrhynchus]|uniref:Uncharacterized protein n=1 Tax=Rangifer tarandus platyrhynchus TaxID=3082113 RepID=A0ABN9A197_RANTA|nr:unnamed protein product [Rangifer tarandus platyrhynchus]
MWSFFKVNPGTEGTFAKRRPDVCGQGVPGLSSIQRLQGRVLPASSSFWGLQASVPGLVAASLQSLPATPRGFSSVSLSLLCLIRILSLGLGPPPSRRTSSLTLHSITSAETQEF